MRWLMIAFLVSLGALLVAAAGLARHIWLHRAKLQAKAKADAASANAGPVSDAWNEVEEVDREL
jgi:hypothetical protein